MKSKFKIDYKSIKFKTCLYFILFAAVLMATMWILQIVLLNNFYGLMKSNQTHKVASDLQSAYKYSSDEEFLAEVDNVSDTYDMYVYVISYDGNTTYFEPSAKDVSRIPSLTLNEGASSVALQNQFAKEIKELNKEMISGNGSAYLKFNGVGHDQEILAYGSVLRTKGKDPMIIYIFSPLWPISSTLKILTNQLISVTLIALLLACIISIYLSTRISRPIRKINHSAKRLANGEYGVVFRGGHYTELIDLADTLSKASVELEKKEMMQRDLIANVSHDLKTPLTMIKSYAEMIRDISGDNPAKREQHLQVIMDESDRLNGLVEDLLTISRLQSGTQSLNTSDFNLNETVENILNTYRVMEVEDTYKFNLSGPSDIYVHADKDKIKQVISNFISNALKFCGEDKEINISLSKRGRFVQLSVEDHGPGIAPNDVEHIWDRYYRSSSNMVRSSSGTGLGLSICKEILTLHKAEFGVDSVVGEGTTFWFQLPTVKKPVNQ